ncbi:hypothetical protein BpHYR1_047054 [Brachionus plicatilis]|uniref:Uncharacterized protein n=1 Tax=Brachionus plicatilis TaxID=10195 RepID=A0A3M7RYE0_BRAPC|nr:hypothetical protein BpHYR1_047054 [Brachionus plicatilis]
MSAKQTCGITNTLKLTKHISALGLNADNLIVVLEEETKLVCKKRPRGSKGFCVAMSKSADNGYLFKIDSKIVVNI